MYVSYLCSAHSNSTLPLGVVHRVKVFAFGGTTLSNFVKGLYCQLFLHSITRSAKCRRVACHTAYIAGCLLRA